MTSGCSGASCTEVAPKIVSTRVVKTVIVDPPVRRAIQLEIHQRAFAAADPVALHGADFFRPAGRLSRSRSNSSAYLVVRKNHCSSSRCSTSVSSWRQQHPPTTCSFASTVAHFGHQLTLLFLRYARPFSNNLRKNHWFHL